MDNKLDESDIDYVALLHESLIKDKLIYIGHILYDVKEQTLEDLMGYTRDNLVEILRGINNDENNKYKIKTANLYKFAKIVNDISTSKKAATKRIITKSGKMQFLFITKQEEEAMKTIQFGQKFMKQNVLNMKTLSSNLNDNNQNIKHNLEQICDLLKQQIDEKQDEMMKVINDIDNYYFTQLKQQNQTIQECAESVAKCYSNYQNCFSNDSISKSEIKDKLIASKKGINIEMDKLMQLIDLTYNINIVFNKDIIHRFFAQCLNLSNVHVDLLPVIKTPQMVGSVIKWEIPKILEPAIKCLSMKDEQSIHYQILYRGIRKMEQEDEKEEKKDEKEEKKDDNEEENENNDERKIYEWNEINNLMNITEYNINKYIKPPYEAKINYTINHLLKSYQSAMGACNHKSFIGKGYNSVLHNFDANELINNGWKCVYDKPYSHVTSTELLKSLCANNSEIEVFVGAAHKNSKNTIILGAFGPSSVLHRFTTSTSQAFIPDDVKNKNDYKIYWYNYNGGSFGFASTAKVSIGKGSADTASADGNDRLSWHIQHSAGGYRIGTKTSLNGSTDYYKQIYIAEH